MVDLPLPRSGLPGLEPLLNGGLWDQWAAEGKVFAVPEFRRSVRYLRLKPDTSCRLAIFRGLLGPSVPALPPIGTLLYLFPSGDRAQEFYDKRSAGKLWRSSPTHEPFLDTGRAIVAVPFPNDREVPALRHLYRHFRLKELLRPYLPGLIPPGWEVSKRDTRLGLIRYKAGRRAVFRYMIGLRETATGARRSISIHLKAESTETFAPLRNAFVKRLPTEIEPTGVRVPRVHGTDSARFLTVRPWYEGRDLTERVNDGDDLRRAGRALAALHGVTPSMPAPAIDDPVQAAIAEADGLGVLLPEETARIKRLGDAIATRLDELTAGRQVLLHGDFHPGQVLFDAAGVMLIDLDRCGEGHPALDLGSFLAHSVELQLDDQARDAFLDGYSTASHAAVAPADLAVGYCLGLLRRCGRPFRDLNADWPALVRSRLDRLESACRELG